MSNANPFPGCVMLSRVRLSFPALTAPRAPKGSVAGVVPSYSADFILNPQDPKYAEFVKIANELAQAKWGQHYPNIIKAIYADKDRRCFGQGEEKIDGTTYQVYDGYQGHVWISAKKKSDKGRPQMIGADNNGIDPNNTLEWENEARKLYGGCYVNAVVKPWLYDNTFGKGFGADLVAIQFAADGTAFGEAIRDASAMFAGAQVAPSMPGAAPAWGAPAAPGMPTMPPGGFQMPQMPGAPFPGLQQPAMPAAPFPMPGAVPPPPFPGAHPFQGVPQQQAPKTPWG